MRRRYSARLQSDEGSQELGRNVELRLVGAERHSHLVLAALSPSCIAHLRRDQILEAALPAANSTGSQTGENGGA